MRDGVAKADADRFVDLARTFVALRHELLHFHETLGKLHLRRKLDARERREAGDALLAKVLHRATDDRRSIRRAARRLPGSPPARRRVH